MSEPPIFYSLPRVCCVGRCEWRARRERATRAARASSSRGSPSARTWLRVTWALPLTGSSKSLKTRRCAQPVRTTRAHRTCQSHSLQVPSCPLLDGSYPVLDGSYPNRKVLSQIPFVRYFHHLHRLLAALGNNVFFDVLMLVVCHYVVLQTF